MSFKISDAVTYIGADDHSLDLFESQYPVPDGISYNSYLITDEKTAVLDTADSRVASVWEENLLSALNGRSPDYLVISHMEPDHSACIARLSSRFPKMQLVGNSKTFLMLSRYFEEAISGRTITVKDGDTLSLGAHTLRFIMAPMVHWPEVMTTYEESEGLLFSADAFGTFGALSSGMSWTDEARRYYYNIVGKYGVQVQNLLKKVAAFDIRAICPLHGPVLCENLEYYVEKYKLWSSYAPEERGVFIACSSIHGNTAASAQLLAKYIKDAGEATVSVMDLSRCDMSVAVTAAFRYDRLILASPTMDGGLFPPMEEFLLHLKSKSFQKRTVGLIENGSWAPVAGRLMGEYLEKMKDITLCGPLVTVNSALNSTSREAVKALATAICAAQ